MDNKGLRISICAAIVSGLILCQTGFSQRLDSLRYDHGLLYYHDYGAQDLPAVIILTGGPGNSYDQLDGLAKNISPNFRGILPEQRGTGRSIPSPFNSKTINLSAVTLDVRQLMDSVGLENAIILGHSWGGMLAMNFAAEYPDRVSQLILIAPGPHKEVKSGFEVLFANREHTRSFEEDQRLEELNKKAARGKADDSELTELKKLLRRAYVFEKPIPDSVFQQINADNNTRTASLMLDDLYKNYDVSESLKNYTGQIDVIVGRQDVVGFASYELQHDIPAARLHWINKCGHFPMYEQPEEFYRILFEVLGL